MSNLLHTDIEIGDLSLKVDLEYDFIPGEKMVRYDRDGSGYPGSPPSAELVGVIVKAYAITDEQRKRDDHWMWKALDTIAAELVSREWDRFGEKCIEDANDRSEGYDDL